MRSIRKLSYQTATRAWLLSLHSTAELKIARSYRCQFWSPKPYSSGSYRCQVWSPKPYSSGSSLTSIQNPVLDFRQELTLSSKSFSTLAGTISVQARDAGKLYEEIENAIDEHRYDDAWNLHQQHMQNEGLPRKSVVNKLVGMLAASLDVQWVKKAYKLVERAFEEHKQNLLEKESLICLSLGLARCGLAVPASTILRKLVEMELFPPVAAWSAILAYMSQTASGAYFAAELVLEIGYLFQDGRVDPHKKVNEPLIAMKPNTTVINIALAGCLLFGTTRKAEQLLDMILQINVKADTNLLILMAHIYEKNGRKEELKKLQRHVDEAHNLTNIQFRQFYNCLVSCHLNSGDLGSASHMVLEMLRRAKKAQNSLGVTMLSSNIFGSRNLLPSAQVYGLGSDHRRSDAPENPRLLRFPYLSYKDFCRDQKFLNLESESREVLDALMIKLQDQVEFITTEHHIVQPTEKIYVKLVKAFLEAGKIKDLADFLIKAEREDSLVSTDNSALVHVINACISFGWLGQAHDLLNEMHLAGVKTGSSLYASLLKAYCKEDRAGEVTSLLRDARKTGIRLDSRSYEALMPSKLLHKDTQEALSLYKEMKEASISRGGHQEFDMLVEGCEGNADAGLMGKLLREIKEGQRIDSGVHDWNNIVHFFCKKRLMQDAEKALEKMRSLGHTPNAQTFHSLVTGYAAIGGKYVEVTELWGEMKALAFSNGMKFDQELLDSALYTFVRGGFFVRANEVVEILEKESMFVDKYKYRALFLKYHKTLYKGKPPKSQTESQLKRREAALAFKKWVGLC